MRSYDVYRDWEDFNGRTVTVDGMECVLRVMSWDVIYPSKRRVINVMAEPTARAKRTERYREVRRILGDDWATDVLESENAYVEIAGQLGM